MQKKMNLEITTLEIITCLGDKTTGGGVLNNQKNCSRVLIASDKTFSVTSVDANVNNQLNNKNVFIKHSRWEKKLPSNNNAGCHSEALFLSCNKKMTNSFTHFENAFLNEYNGYTYKQWRVNTR